MTLQTPTNKKELEAQIQRLRHIVDTQSAPLITKLAAGARINDLETQLAHTR